MRFLGYPYSESGTEREREREVWISRLVNDGIKNGPVRDHGADWAGSFWCCYFSQSQIGKEKVRVSMRQSKHGCQFMEIFMIFVCPFSDVGNVA